MTWKDKRAVDCVHGLAPMKRWLGDEVAMRTTLMAPAVVVAYNKYMNSVDRFDQLRATLKGVRKEKRVSSSIFAFIVDAAVQNAFSVNKLLRGEDDKRTLSEYKLDMALEMMQASGITAQAETAVDVDEDEDMDEVVIAANVQGRHGGRRVRGNANVANVADGTTTTTLETKKLIDGLGCYNATDHLLVELKDTKAGNCSSGRCFMCSLVSGQDASKSKYGCIACAKPFHVNCFAVYHSNKFEQQHRDAVTIVNDAMVDKNKKRQFTKVSTQLPTSLEEVIPSYKKVRRER